MVKSTINKYWKVLALAICITSTSSCYREETVDNSPMGNFEALWKILDEGYCYFTYKNIDWDEVYYKYKQQISSNMSSEELFDVLGEMTRELRDGHVNLASSWNLARYWEWYQDYPRNFDETIQDNYLGKDYRIAGGIKYKILEDNIGYIYYENFASPIGDGNINHILKHLELCDGIIIDIRNNGGGNITNSSKLASHFIEEELITGYIMHKKGPSHDSFSNPYPIKLSPAKGIRWQEGVALLINRHTYSAANDFTNNMSLLDNVTLIGDRTGGGGGLPFTSELPNGWTLRYSASPHLDANKEHIEFGIDPDIKVDMNNLDKMQGKDTIIETARNLLKKES